MEKVAWKGTFAEAESREDAYWAATSFEERLAYLLEVRQIFFEDADAEMKKVFVKPSGDEKE